jgi:hypothetical protein
MPRRIFHVKIIIFSDSQQGKALRTRMNKLVKANVAIKVR